MIRDFQIPLWRIAVFLTLMGCGGDDSKPRAIEQATMPSWSEQIEAVRQGQSKVIDIQLAAIRDEQLNELVDLEKLEVLKLNQGAITDEGLKSLASLPLLRQLVLRDSPLTDAGAETLAAFGSLQILNAPQTRIGDMGIEHLSRIKSLELLRLGSDQPISAAALRNLKNANSLRFIHFIGIPFNDDALGPLGDLENLESLYIDGCEFSDAALADLFQRRPNLHVHLDQKHADSDPKAAKHRH
jgi:hypothetical protein